MKFLQKIIIVFFAIFSPIVGYVFSGFILDLTLLKNVSADTNDGIGGGCAGTGSGGAGAGDGAGGCCTA